ncbi:MAG: TetR family transcriptional regulator [Alphaproteobacteria bacterium]|nr:TetR family transcriptional regulator [Alphaproteobacteria bacterium]
MVRRTKEEAEQTRNHILDAAERLFYDQGVARTSLEGIARAAGVTRGAVYWHFRNKIDVFVAMQERARLPQEDVIEQLAQTDTDDGLLSLREACKSAILMIAGDERSRRVCSILMHRCEYVEEMGDAALRRQINKQHLSEHLIRIFEIAEKRGTLSPNWTPRLSAISLHGLIHGLLNDWLSDPEQYDMADSGPRCIDAFFKGLAPDLPAGTVPKG